MDTFHRLDRIYPAPIEKVSGADESHPMRRVTRQIAESETGWDKARASKVKALFDGMATDWGSRSGMDRTIALVDALDRGEVAPGGLCCEVGCGSGVMSPILIERFSGLICFDLSTEMLRRAPDTLPRVVADASRLPLPDSSIDVLVVVNMFLFPPEYTRVVKPGGRLVWASSNGDATPIYLPLEDVAEALSGGFSSVGADAGPGCWLVATKY